ncbi:MULTISPECIES: AMP-binding protein [unclassified Crossiella]|uniref:AMP-binding protein n=1 Tax=unclassified Crossiella TaxID=2620835 RepID=UPI00249513AB|nr:MULTISPECIES: AMP-binding protein [unclassified Crossiella]
MDEKSQSKDLVSALQSRTENAPEHVAVTFVADVDDPMGHIGLTYAQLDERARRLAVWLAGRFAPGDRALLLFNAGVEFGVAFYGCLYAGLVAVPCPRPGRYRHERHRTAGIARDADVAVLLTDSATLDSVEKWTAEEGLSALPVGVTDTVEADPGDWRRPALSTDSLALLQYTSGSTGSPKGVMVGHGNLLDNAESIRTTFGLDRQSRWGGWIPLYHDMGLIGHLITGTLCGTGFVQLDPTAFLRRPHHWLKVLDRFDVNATASPDFGYDQCSRRVTDEQLAELDLSRLRAAINGSEPVRSATLDRFIDRFGPAGFRPRSMLPTYGLAEATLLATGTHGRPPHAVPVDVPALEQGELRAAAPGVPARDLVGCGISCGFDVLVVDPHTREVRPDGRIGEIWLGGHTVAQGYWRNRQATEATFDAHTADGRGPYLRTGDLGGWLAGDLFVTGRHKDTMVVHGRNIHPQDVEHEVRDQHEELAGLHSVAFTVDGAGGEVVVLVQEIRGSHSPEQLGAIAEAATQTIAREFGVPVGGVVLVRPGAVLRTTSGKVRRSDMRRNYLAGLLEPLHSNEDPLLAGTRQRRTELRDWLITRVATYLRRRPADIDPARPLAEYGLDSVTTLAITTDVEDRYDLVVDPALAWTHPTADALTTALATLIEEKTRQ